MKIAEEVVIDIEGAKVGAFLHVPDAAKGIVLFAHGSGSSRHSPRNQFVAKYLHEQNLATLLMDLLTEDEEQVDLQTQSLRFDIPFLAARLMAGTKWLEAQPHLKQLSVGYFGASTGAAAALCAAAKLGDHIAAIVSRGGRPDLAHEALRHVKCPTLLIVGGEDLGVIELNEKGLALLGCQKKIEIVPHATHLFQEPGTLEEVARLAAHWFETHI